MVRMSEFLNDLPGETNDPEPRCGYCGDSGTTYPNWVDMDNTGEMEFCECSHGDRADYNDACGRPLDAPISSSTQQKLDWSSGDEMDYQAGVARGNLHAAERKIYGSQLADEFAFMDEMNDYNNGLI